MLPLPPVPTGASTVSSGPRFTRGMKLLPTFCSHLYLLCETTLKQLHTVCHDSREQLLRLTSLRDQEVLGSDHGSSGNSQPLQPLPAAGRRGSACYFLLALSVTFHACMPQGLKKAIKGDWSLQTWRNHAPKQWYSLGSGKSLRAFSAPHPEACKFPFRFPSALGHHGSRHWSPHRSTCSSDTPT